MRLLGILTIQAFKPAYLRIAFSCHVRVMKQIVKEMLDNAVDACRCRTSEQDGPTVRVVLRRRCNNKADVEAREDDELDEQEDGEVFFSFGHNSVNILLHAILSHTIATRNSTIPLHPALTTSKLLLVIRAHHVIGIQSHSSYRWRTMVMGCTTLPRPCCFSRPPSRDMVPVAPLPRVCSIVP